MIRTAFLIVFALALTLPAKAFANPVEAEEAIRLSIAQPHAPLEPMWIEMNVCRSGAVGETGFLNSMRDYRDRASLNVELPPSVRTMLTRRLGGDPVDVLAGYRVRFLGAPRQVRIQLFRDGVPTGEYYFQTQVRLSAAYYLDLVRIEGDAVTAECSPLVG